MKLLTLSEDGVPLLDGEPIDGLIAFKISQEGIDEFAFFDAKILVCLNPKDVSNQN